MKAVTIVLLIISAFLSFKHGWDAFHPSHPEQTKMMADLGINKSIFPYIGAISIILGILLFFSQTFFVSNVLSAILILSIMGLSLKAGNAEVALIEIPFLALPLLLIWLKYPFRF